MGPDLCPHFDVTNNKVKKRRMFPHLARSQLPRGPEELSRVGQPLHLLLDPEQLVVLGEPLAPAGRPALDVPRANSDDQVGDEGVLRLAGPVGHKDAPTGFPFVCLVAFAERG